MYAVSGISATAINNGNCTNNKLYIDNKRWRSKQVQALTNRNIKARVSKQLSNAASQYIQGRLKGEARGPIKSLW